MDTNNNNNKNSILVLGENTDGLLFKFAIEAAKEGKKVWYISAKPFNDIPKDVFSPGKDILELITFIYLNNAKELLKHLHGIHEWRYTPTVIILNHFEHFAQFEDNHGNLSAMLLATLIDSMLYLGSKKAGSKINMLISCSNQEFFLEKLKMLYHHYFDHVFFKTNNLSIDELLEELISLAEY